MKSLLIRQTSQKQSNLEKWRNHNLYYYKDLEKFFRFFVPPSSKVLEAGSGTGYLLDAVEGSRSVGIDINQVAIEDARRRFTCLDFFVEDIEDFQSRESFDYVLLANTVSYIGDIQKAFQNIRKVSYPSTRLILTFHNPKWELILQMATAIGQRMPLPPLNWLSVEDIENLLDLSDFEIVSHGKRLLFPKRLPFLSYFFNNVLAPLPLLNRLCLTEYIIARPRPTIVQTRELSCSVIIPARNEAGNIESCITRLPRMGKHVEVIFVEGHSTILRTVFEAKAETRIIPLAFV